MIKYYCDICHEELRGEYFHEFESSMSSPYHSRYDNKTTLHFHDKCLRRMFDYLLNGEENHELKK